MIMLLLGVKNVWGEKMCNTNSIISNTVILIL